MAKRNSTVKKVSKGKRESAADRADRIRMALAGAGATVITTKLVLQGNGVMDDVAFNLTRGALLPIEALIAEFEAVAHG
jgi:hypothetical protein